MKVSSNYQYVSGLMCYEMELVFLPKSSGAYLYFSDSDIFLYEVSFTKKKCHSLN